MLMFILFIFQKKIHQYNMLIQLLFGLLTHISLKITLLIFLSTLMDQLLTFQVPLKQLEQIIIILKVVYRIFLKLVVLSKLQYFQFKWLPHLITLKMVFLLKMHIMMMIKHSFNLFKIQKNFKLLFAIKVNMMHKKHVISLIKVIQLTLQLVN